MVQDPEISRYNLVFQDGTGGYVDLSKQAIVKAHLETCRDHSSSPYLVTLICNDDDRTLENDSPAESDVARHGQMIQLNDVWDAGKALQEVTNLANRIVMCSYQEY